MLLDEHERNGGTPQPQIDQQKLRRTLSDVGQLIIGYVKILDDVLRSRKQSNALTQETSEKEKPSVWCGSHKRKFLGAIAPHATRDGAALDLIQPPTGSTNHARYERSGVLT